MAIDKQSEGNRLSKLKSTGPSGLKHGLSRLVLSTESEADFQALLDSYEAEHKPATATERALVEQLATTTWRLRRLHNIEAGLYKLTILTRQQARLERSFHKALRELQRMQRERSVKVASQKASAVAQTPQQPAKLNVSDPPMPTMTNIPRS
jgi:hypothetical protein